MLVGKKLGSAPQRNRQKRWVREAFRRARRDLSVPGSIIVRIAQPIESFAQVQNDFMEAYQVAVQSGRGPGGSLSRHL